jgi:hypothetical protein
MRSSADSSAGSIVASIALTESNEESKRVLRSSASSIIASVALTKSNEGSRRVLRSSVGSIVVSVTLTKSNEESRGVLQSSAYYMRSSAHACKAQSSSYRKAKSQYGKILYVPQPPMTTWKKTLAVPMCCNSAVCRRKETKPWTASKISPSP